MRNSQGYGGSRAAQMRIVPLGKDAGVVMVGV